MAKRISIHPEHVEIKLNLPLEVAEAIVSDGPAIIKALSSALNKQKMEAEAKSPIKRLEVANAASDDDRWLKLYRVADRQIRALRSAESMTDAKAMSQVAKDLNVPYTTLSAVLTRFRKDRRERLVARRNVQVIRMHLLGQTTVQIGSRLKINPVTVTRVLKQEDDLIRSLGKFRNIAKYRRPATLQPGERQPNEDPERLRKRLRAEELKQRRAHLTRLGVQFNRQLRRKTIANKDRYWTLKAMATPHGLHPDDVASLASERKHKVRAYLTRRRGETIQRLMNSELTQNEIAKRFGVSATAIMKYRAAWRQAKSAQAAQSTSPSKGSNAQ